MFAVEDVCVCQFSVEDVTAEDNQQSFIVKFVELLFDMFSDMDIVKDALLFVVLSSWSPICGGLVFRSH